MEKFQTVMAAVAFATFLLGLVACGEVPITEFIGDPHTGPTTGRAKAPSGISTSPVRVSIINVGKGDCILVQAGDASVLIDAGYENTVDDVLSHLRRQGVSHLDAMIITHYDRDHIGGIRAIGESMDVDTVYLPGYEGTDKNYRLCASAVKALGVPTQRVTKKIVLGLGDAQLTVFPSGVAYRPGAGGDEGNDNDVSLVATLINGRDSYLFAGDLEEDGIAAFLKVKHGQFDVVKMPHHGQRSSNTDEFLDEVHPQIAVITDAEKDPANKKTLKTLDSANVETYRTSTSGTVVVASSGNGAYSVSPSKG